MQGHLNAMDQSELKTSGNVQLVPSAGRRALAKLRLVLVLFLKVLLHEAIFILNLQRNAETLQI